MILGFLVEQPLHGYELKQRLSPAVPRDRRMNDGVLYPLLAQLERDGLVRKRVERGAGGRRRHVYCPSAKGRRAFEAWLADGAGEADEVEYDFLIGHDFLHKCLFFAHLPEAAVRAKCEAQRADARAKLRSFKRIRAGMVERSADAYRVAILDLGIAQQRAKVRWLDALCKDALPHTAPAMAATS